MYFSRNIHLSDSKIVKVIKIQFSEQLITDFLFFNYPCLSRHGIFVFIATMIQSDKFRKSLFIALNITPATNILNIFCMKEVNSKSTLSVLVLSVQRTVNWRKCKIKLNTVTEHWNGSYSGQACPYLMCECFLNQRGQRLVWISYFCPVFQQLQTEHLWQETKCQVHFMNMEQATLLLIFVGGFSFCFFPSLGLELAPNAQLPVLNTPRVSQTVMKTCLFPQ